MPRRRARRIVALILVGAVLALGLALGLRRHALQASAYHVQPPAPHTAGAAAAARTPPAAAGTTLQPAAMPAATDAKAAAARWAARVDAIIARRRARQVGSEDARIAALPPGQAWQQLTARADQGDLGAAALALQLAQQCELLRERRDALASPRHAEHVGEKLPAEWRERLQQIARIGDARLLERADDCVDVGNGLEFASLRLDALLQADNPDTQLAFAADIEDDGEAIAALRDLADRLGTEAARRELGERLLRARDAALSAEGLQLLLGLAAADDEVATFLAGCYRNGCSGFRPDLAAAAPWLERAAGQGDPIALAAEIDDATERSDLVSAWAWTMYRLQLTEDGCYEFALPEPDTLDQAARQALALDRRLDASQRAQAQALLDTLAARWIAAARTDLECGA